MYTYMITYRHTLSSQVHVFSSFCFEVAFASKYFCFLGIRSVFRSLWRSFHLERQSVSASNLKNMATTTKNTLALQSTVVPCTNASEAATMTQTSFTSITASKQVLGSLSAWQLPRRLTRTFWEAHLLSVHNRAWTYVSQGRITGAATTTPAATGGPRHPSSRRRCETF